LPSSPNFADRAALDTETESDRAAFIPCPSVGSDNQPQAEAVVGVPMTNIGRELIPAGKTPPRRHRINFDRIPQLEGFATLENPLWAINIIHRFGLSVHIL
jgi:hypothetical protein